MIKERYDAKHLPLTSATAPYKLTTTGCDGVSLFWHAHPSTTEIQNLFDAPTGARSFSNETATAWLDLMFISPVRVQTKEKQKK